MLNRRLFPLQQALKYRFSSADSHGHHETEIHPDYRVNIDRNATWIKFRGPRKLVSLQGLQQTHVQLKNRDTADCWEHRRTQPYISYVHFYIDDAWHHLPEDELLYTDVERGYAHNEDPLDTRLTWDGYLLSVCGGMVALLILLLGMEHTMTPQAHLLWAKKARQYAKSQLQKYNTQLNKVKEEGEKLKAELFALQQS